MGGGLVRYKSFVMDSSRWEGFAFRDGDIVISTPAKCGTTWTQMIVALLVFQDPVLPRPLAEISPWLDMLLDDRQAVFDLLDAQEHRRFIKSHTPFDGLPYDERVTYLCVGRDPRDAGFSWDNHVANMHMDNLVGARAAAVGLDDVADLGEAPAPAEDVVGRFWQWVEDEAPVVSATSLSFVIHHLRTFWEARHLSNVVLLHYGDLLRDLEGEMRRLADRLGIVVAEDRWPALVEAARFDQMQARAEVVVPSSTHAIWHDNRRFFDKGGTRWVDHLDDADLRRYQARLAQLDAPPDLLAWAHGDTASVQRT